MLKVRVSKVTSGYLKEQGIEAGVWYDADRLGQCGRLKDPKLGVFYIMLDGEICPHLQDNEQTEWEVSDA